jgi:hypothetical protein
MPDELQLEWTYEPPGLFEERAELLVDRCAFVIDARRVTVRAPFEGNPETDIRSHCNELHQRLDGLFLAAQMLAHKAYVLSKPGRLSAFLQMSVAAVNCTDLAGQNCTRCKLGSSMSDRGAADARTGATGAVTSLSGAGSE